MSNSNGGDQRTNLIPSDQANRPCYVRIQKEGKRAYVKVGFFDKEGKFNALRNFTYKELCNMTDEEVEALSFIVNVETFEGEKEIEISFVIQDERIDITANTIFEDYKGSIIEDHEEAASSILYLIDKKYPLFSNEPLIEGCDTWVEEENGVTFYQWFIKTNYFESLTKEELLLELMDKVNNAWEEVNYHREKTEHDDEELNILLFNNNADWGYQTHSDLVETLETEDNKLVNLCQEAYDKRTFELIEAERPEEELLAEFYDWITNINKEDRNDRDLLVENFITEHLEREVSEEELEELQMFLANDKMFEIYEK